MDMPQSGKSWDEVRKALKERGQGDANPFKGRKKSAPSKLRKHTDGRRRS